MNCHLDSRLTSLQKKPDFGYFLTRKLLISLIANLRKMTFSTASTPEVTGAGATKVKNQTTFIPRPVKRLARCFFNYVN